MVEVKVVHMISFFHLISSSMTLENVFVIELIKIINVQSVGGECDHGDVRLVGGSDSSEGSVEVCLEGIWGNVNDRSWNGIAAKVVCRQLGYSDKGIV